jgi:hypothetical protein
LRRAFLGTASDVDYSSQMKNAISSVDDQRLDEGEIDDHREADRTGRAGVAGDALDRGGEGAGLADASGAATPSTNTAPMRPQRTPFGWIAGASCLNGDRSS